MPDNLELMTSLKPSDTQEIIIREEIPSIKPIMLRVVEKEIKPKLCPDHRWRKAIRDRNFIFLHYALQEIISHLLLRIAVLTA